MILERLRRGLVVLAALAISSAPGGAAQTRDTRPAERPAGTISGVAVTTDPEPKPIRKVRVTCVGPDGSVSAITDDRGRFVFAGLKPGRYTIGGTKDAWVTSVYGAKRPLRPGSAIPLAAGQTISIALKMTRGAVITGVLLDYNNQPAANTQVSALRYFMQNGTRRLDSMAGAVTDDRGVYRIYGLPPGDYFVGAAARGASLNATIRPGVNAPVAELRLIDERLRAERTVAFASTYFPGTSIATQASPITLNAGEERDGIDFALQLVPTARVEGSVTNPDGSPAPAGTLVNLNAGLENVFPGSGIAGFRSSRAGADGTFSFLDVSPGTYSVIARGGPPLTWASSEIALDGESVTGLTLGLQPGLTMTGQIRFDATRLTPPADLKSIRISLQPVQSQGVVSLAPSGTVADNSGHFEITGIIPGTYRVTASLQGLGRPGNWFLRSAVVRGEETLDAPLTIRPNETLRGASIVFSDRPAQLSGSVQNAAGGAPNEFTVILFPEDRAFWTPQSRRIFAMRPSADGAFSFTGLVPGDYLLAAIDDIEPGEWFDPTLLQRLVPAALKIAIGEGEQKAQDIRLGGG
jgi:uncharacterized protein (DUF2141 family)